VTHPARNGGVESNATNGPAAPKRPGPGIKERSLDAATTLLPLQLAACLHRDALKNKAYRAFPIGQRGRRISAPEPWPPAAEHLHNL
jgi:hypothetical protein